MDFASAKYDVADAFAANELYQDNGWTDGLPICERRFKRARRRPRRARCRGSDMRHVLFDEDDAR